MDATEQDSLSGLEERLVQVVDLVARLKEENQTLASENQAMKQELATLRSERAQVRSRIERLLGQINQVSKA